MKQKPLTNKKGEVRSLTKKDFKSMRPINEVLPKELLDVISRRKRGERGEQKSPKKVPISIRINPAVVRHFKNSGPGWQAKINSILELHVKRCEKKGKYHAHASSRSHTR